MKSKVLIVLLLCSLAGASALHAGLKVRTSVNLWERNVGTLLSAGLAEAYDPNFGAVVASMDIDHRIGEVGAFRLIAQEDGIWGYYNTNVEGYPSPDRCYTASIEGTIRATGVASYSQAAQVCVLSKDTGGDKGIDCPDLNCESPIVLDMLGNGFRFTGLDRSVRFDIDGDGVLDRLSWTDPASDDVFLALDRNGNGRIDDGTELFGDSTPQPASSLPNGYRALGVFDLDGDGAITSADPVHDSLVLWRDANHDGASQPWEIEPLAAGVASISLDYVTSGRRDPHGNLLRWTSETEIHGRRGLRSVDVLLRRDETP